MNWVNVLAQNELPPDARKVVNVGEKKVLLLNTGGAIYALNNNCPHLNLPLKGGKIKDGALICPFHHSAFDLKTGEAKAWCTFPPVIGGLLGAISQAKPAVTYPTRVENGQVFVGLA
jgi:nitrite reductase/ring-hydroxylating ferredoxin subunit